LELKKEKHVDNIFHFFKKHLAFQTRKSSNVENKDELDANMVKLYSYLLENSFLKHCTRIVYLFILVAISCILHFCT